MLDIGWTEILVIAVVAIVVIGPKDLPRTLRTVGQWVAKARGMTRDLQNSVNDMIAESEIDELRKAGQSIGDFGSSDIMSHDFNADILTDQSKTETENSDYPTPPATPLKWPPDDHHDDHDDDNDYDASDEELAAMAPDLTDGDDLVPAASAADEAKDDLKRTDT